MQRRFATGDSLELTPTRLGRRGEVEADHEGWRVRITGGIVGEAARVTLVHVSTGAPVAVAEWDGPAEQPHAARREPPCPIHSSCGGCGLQHVQDDAALAMKVDHARTLLGLDPGVMRTAIRSPQPFGYRCKTFLLPQIRAGRLMLGARPPRGNRMVDTSGCNVLRPPLEALAARTRAVLLRRTEESHHLRAALLRCNRAGQTQVTLVHRGRPGWLEECALAVGADAAFLQRHDKSGNRTHSDEPEPQVLGSEPITESYDGPDGICAFLPPTAFLQGNPDVAEKLYRCAAGELEGRILELYCGSGVAGLLALKRNPGATLSALDRAPRAIEMAQRNARRNGLNAAFFVGVAGETAVDADVVLMNPPRAGCDEAVLRAIAASSARKLVYLSCSPATLARDAQRLGWTLDSVTPADMFPQTPHLELLAVFRRSRG